MKTQFLSTLNNSSGFIKAVPIIITINVGVFLTWLYAGKSELLIFMTKNFLVSWEALVQGRDWTLLTSVFSHNMFLHIFLNMYVLHSFGPIVERVLGFRRFFVFYCVAGIVSSLVHSVVSASFMDKPELPALGASGAIAGLVLLFSLLYPREKILLFGFIPTPALFGAFIFIGLDVWGLTAQIQGGGLPIGHGAHIGGSLTGIIYFFWALRNRRASRINY